MWANKVIVITTDSVDKTVHDVRLFLSSVITIRTPLRLWPSGSWSGAARTQKWGSSTKMWSWRRSAWAAAATCPVPTTAWGAAVSFTGIMCPFSAWSTSTHASVPAAPIFVGLITRKLACHSPMLRVTSRSGPPSWFSPWLIPTQFLCRRNTSAIPFPFPYPVIEWWGMSTALRVRHH